MSYEIYSHRNEVTNGNGKTTKTPSELWNNKNYDHNQVTSDMCSMQKCNSSSKSADNKQEVTLSADTQQSLSVNVTWLHLINNRYVRSANSNVYSVSSIQAPSGECWYSATDQHYFATLILHFCFGNQAQISPKIQSLPSGDNFTAKFIHNLFGDSTDRENLLKMQQISQT